MIKDSNHTSLPEELRGESGSALGSEERYRELFENSRDAIYVHDLGGRYVLVNRLLKNSPATSETRFSENTTRIS